MGPTVETGLSLSSYRGKHRNVDFELLHQMAGETLETARRANLARLDQKGARRPVHVAAAAVAEAAGPTYMVN